MPVMDSIAPRVTLKDLSVGTGLSIAPISMALRNHPRIAKATCERVQLLARERGYRPDPALSALAAYRQDQRIRPVQTTIAVVYLAPKGAKISDQETREEFRGISSSAQKLGYGLDVFSTDLEETSQARTLRVIHSRGIRGIIFQFLDAEPSQLKANWGFVAAVGIGMVAHHSKLPLPTICADHSHGSYECVSQLAAIGYNRPALLIPSAYPAPLQVEILGGYMAGLRNCSGRPDARDIVINFSAESWKMALSRFVAKRKPDALICAGRAEFLYDHLRGSAGLGVCTLDAVPENRSISGMLQDRLGVGIVAMESLHKLILANVAGPSERSQTIYLPGAWRHGKSLVPVAPASGQLPIAVE